MMRARLGVVAVVIGALTMAACGSSDSGDTASGGPKGDCPTAAVPVVVTRRPVGRHRRPARGRLRRRHDDHHRARRPTRTTTSRRRPTRRVHGREARRRERPRLRPVGRARRSTRSTTSPPWSNGGEVVGLAGRRQPAHLVRPALRVRGRRRRHRRARAARARRRRVLRRTATPRGAASMRPYDAEIERIKRVADGQDRTARPSRSSTTWPTALGLDERDARGLPRRRRERVRSCARRRARVRARRSPAERIDVLVFNTQTEGAIPEQLRERGRAIASVPVVDVTETRAAGVRHASSSGRSSQLEAPRDGARQRDADALDARRTSPRRAAATSIWSEGTFSVPTGAIVGVIGPNGSGKTTLLEMILGLLPSASGTLAVLGEAPHRGNAAHRLRPAELHRRDRRGDPVPRPGRARPHRNADGVSASPSPRRPRPRRRARWRRSPRSDVRHADGSRSSRAASSNGSRSPRRSSATRSCCSSTSRSPTSTSATSTRSSSCSARLRPQRDVTILVVVHDLNPLLSILDGAIYLLDGHAHYGAIGDVVDSELLTHLYGTPIKVVRTAQGDLFTRS